MTNAVAASLGTLVTHFEVKKLIGYTLLDRIKDTYKSLISALIMGAVVVWIKYSLIPISIPVIFILIIEVLAGGISYIILSILLKNDVFNEMLSFMKKKRKL